MLDPRQLRAILSKMGESPQSSAPAASRLPPPRASLARSSLAASLGNLDAELQHFAQATDIVARHLDEKTVRRSFRTWSRWIDRRAHNADWALALEGALAKPLAKLIPKNAIIAELCPAQIDVTGDAPWPRVPCAKLPGGSQPLAIRLLVIVDPVAFNSNAKLLAAMHREAVLLLSDGGTAPSAFRPPLGRVIVGTAADHKTRPFFVEADADKDIGAVIDRILTPAGVAMLKGAVAATDHFTFAAALVRDDEATRRAAPPAANAQNDLKALQAQKAATEMARADIRAIFERHLRKFRLSRGGIDTSKIALNVGQQDVIDLIQPFHPQNGQQVNDMLDKKEQLNWWQDTPIEWLKWSFNEKYRVSLTEDSLREVTGRVRDATFEQIRAAIRRTKRELTSALDYAGESHPQALAAISAGGLAAQDDLAKDRMKRSVSAAFDDFTRLEASSFHVDMEDKGLVGQLSEARSAVFGLFFILLMFSRPLGDGCTDPKTVNGWFAEWSCFLSTWMPKVMSWGMLALMLIGLMVNFLFRKRRKKVQIYQRFEARLGDFRARLITLVDKVVKDELSLVDLELSENSAVVDAALARDLTAVQAQIEHAASGNQSSRGIRLTTPAARNTVLEDAQNRISLRTRESLEQRFRESFAKDFAEQLA